jgi:hypothetical protein
MHSTTLKYLRDPAPLIFLRYLYPLSHEFHADEFSLLNSTIFILGYDRQNGKPIECWYVHANQYDGFVPHGDDSHGGLLVSAADLVTPYTLPLVRHPKDIPAGMPAGTLPPQIDTVKWCYQRTSSIQAANKVRERYHARRA